MPGLEEKARKFYQMTGRMPSFWNPNVPSSERERSATRIDKQDWLGVEQGWANKSPYVGSQIASQDSMVTGLKPKSGIGAYEDQLKTIEMQNKLNREKSKAESWERIGKQDPNWVGTNKAQSDSSNVGLPTKSKSPEIQAPDNEYENLTMEIELLSPKIERYEMTETIDDAGMTQNILIDKRSGEPVSDPEAIKEYQESQRMYDLYTKERDRLAVKRAKSGKSGTKKIEL